MFTKTILDYENNMFPLLSTINFENITKGRKGAVLINAQNNLIPLVRTTSKYINSPQQFNQIHLDIINKIKEMTNIDNLCFNNALIEMYDNSYCTMGFHSDQALDLANDSYIAIYSCYKNINTVNHRKLIVKNKTTNKISEIIMDHNSVILFDLTSNQQHLHKIILNNINKDNEWLGITFRCSKTFVHHINNVPYFYKTDVPLKLATDKETKEFYKLRSEENKKTDFTYPNLDFTISPSDLLNL